MKLLLAILLTVSGCAYAQTNYTVVSDLNRVIRTNFTIGNAQVTGLSALFDAKLSTNGNGSALTNITGANVVGTVATASNITSILAISNGGTGSQNASNARTALGLGTAATNAATAFQPASAALTNLSANNGGSLTNLNAQNFLPSYSNNALKVLAVASNGTNIEWTAISNTVTDGASITNLALSNTVGTLSVSRGGTGATNAVDARTNLLPAFTNNAGKVLALNTNATDVEWITITNTGGGSTNGVTSVNVSGGSTGLTASGGPITNSGTITLGGTLAIAAGGTGQTNAAAAIEALLPAFTNNAGKVLGLDTNLALTWTTNAGGGSGTVTSVDASGGSTGMNFTGGPVETNGTLTLGGTLAIGSGGTGAGDVTNARINLLPAYTNNAGKALLLNTNGTDIEWVAVASAPVSIVNGGTGATNTTSALVNLTIVNTNNGVRIGPNSLSISGVAIGNSARAQSTNGTDGANGVAIGASAYASTNGVSVGHNAGSVSGVAIGSGALTGAEAIAIGKNSAAEPGIAIGTGAGAYEVGAIALGDSARADNTNSIQIGTGTNSTDNVIQVLNWGLVASNSWSALANSTTFGRYVLAAPTNGTANQVLALNSNATAVVWSSAGSSVIDLSTTNATGILPVAKGGTGATNGAGAMTNFGVFGASIVVLGPGAANVTGGNTIVGGSASADDGVGLGAVAVGREATSSNSSTSIGYQSRGLGEYGTAIGYQTTNSSGRGVAIGYRARISGDGFAAGDSAVATGAESVQLGTGTNTNANSIQFLAAGTVDTNEWSRIAAISTYPTTNISVVGTNNTNTLVFSNGILVEVQ